MEEKKIYIPDICSKCGKKLYIIKNNKSGAAGSSSKNYIYHKDKYICKECFY